MKNKIKNALCWFLFTQYLLFGTWYLGDMKRGIYLGIIFWLVQAISIVGALIWFVETKKD